MAKAQPHEYLGSALHSIHEKLQLLKSRAAIAKKLNSD
jgi:hypothetical protein